MGGLENLTAWFKSRAPAFANTARYAGLPLPKGVLLVGVPGCGKSLSARAGQSEANLRMAIQTAEAVSPCILWIDEVEKGFSGVRGQGGEGVAARVFGSFLNWLQDKRSPVFVVATANDLSGIPPEFLRQGRFDDIFFVGLPGDREREAVFRAHLARRKRDAGRELETADMAAAAKETYPLSRSRAREIALLTAWASRNAKAASR